jgi:acyl-coenzyme A thioesterase PaaI-like protein
VVDDLSLQDRYAARTTCFGCGPANERGLRIKSHVHGDEVVAEWRAESYHEAFPGVLNGGIVGTLLDCHSNWAAAVSLMARAGASSPPATVTADLAVRFLAPAPTAGPIILRARVVDATARRATVESTLEAGGHTCATATATFVAVNPGHPAYGRW